MEDRVKPVGAVFPATYQAPLWDRIKPALIVAPLYILSMAGRSHLSSTSPRWLWVVVVLGFFLIMIGALSIGFCKVTLYKDRIEKRSLFGIKTMRRNDVGKIAKRQRGLVMLTYKYNSADGMMLPMNIGGDEAWNDWMDYDKKL